MFSVAEIFVAFDRAPFVKGAYTIHTRPNAIHIFALQRTNISTDVLQIFVYSQERCMIFKDRMINCSCLCVCCATMRLLLKMSNVILQFYYHCKFYRFQFPCFAISVYWIKARESYFHYYYVIFSTTYGFGSS